MPKNQTILCSTVGLIDSRCREPCQSCPAKWEDTRLPSSATLLWLTPALVGMGMVLLSCVARCHHHHTPTSPVVVNKRGASFAAPCLASGQRRSQAHAYVVSASIRNGACIVHK